MVLESILKRMDKVLYGKQLCSDDYKMIIHLCQTPQPGAGDP